MTIPYRDGHNAIIPGDVAVGVVAYDQSGVNRVEFTLDGNTTTVTTETINPETGEYEYVLNLNPDVLTADGRYVVKATAHSNAGGRTDLPDLELVKDTAAHNVLLVGASQTYTTLDAACQAAEDGDIIRVQPGRYTIPGNTGYGFTQYVTIMPDSSGVTIVPNGTDGTIRSSYVKFKNVTFDISAGPNLAIIANTATHLWFDGCTAIGYGRNESSNNVAAFRSYQDSEHVTIENCTIRDASTGAVLSKGNYIFRHNTVEFVTADGLKFDGSNILISNNLIHDNLLPTGGDQHCDFIESNSGADNVVIRNNECYNGDHQGLKLGGYNDGRDQPYSNIAILNNLFALRNDGAHNFRLGVSGRRFSNILVLQNTFWHGASPFLIDDGVNASDVLLLNNIYGPREVHASSTNGVSIDNSCFYTEPAVGADSFVADPLFTDPTEWDFTLQDGSPTKGKGDGSAGVGYDLRWAPRSTVSPSMGAFE